MDILRWVKNNKADRAYMRVLNKFIKDPALKPTPREKIILGIRADFRVYNGKDRTLKEIIELHT